MVKNLQHESVWGSFRCFFLRAGMPALPENGAIMVCMEKQSCRKAAMSCVLVCVPFRTMRLRHSRLHGMTHEHASRGWRRSRSMHAWTPTVICMQDHECGMGQDCFGCVRLLGGRPGTKIIIDCTMLAVAHVAYDIGILDFNHGTTTTKHFFMNLGPPVCPAASVPIP